VGDGNRVWYFVFFLPLVICSGQSVEIDVLFLKIFFVSTVYFLCYDVRLSHLNKFSYFTYTLTQIFCRS